MSDSHPRPDECRLVSIVRTRVADFDYTATPAVNPAVINTLASGSRGSTGEPVCLIGDSSTGKSHLLIGLGTAAAEA